MQLGAERRGRIRHRLDPILKQYDPELEFVTVFVDSTREDLGVVAQLGERPLLLKFRWVDFISNPDDVLREDVFSQLNEKLGKKP
ncbi:MAG: hypothetical protein HY651_08345 [Acidobacteria bacterium]|nr:hypothetical protein [Acidobacteriota bacterium]